VQEAPISGLSPATDIAVTHKKVSLLPARIVDEARQRVNARWYPSLVVAFIDGTNSEIASFGKLEDGAVPDGRTVYEIGSITKTFTAALLADAIDSGRVTRDTAVATLLPAFSIPTRKGKYITVADLATQSSGLPYMPDNLTPANCSNPFADYDVTKLKSFLASSKQNPLGATKMTKSEERPHEPRCGPTCRCLWTASAECRWPRLCQVVRSIRR
jgi:CubicO group peptidase (beta-lactamase class C family)